MSVPFVDLSRLHSPLREELLASFERVLDSSNYIQGEEVCSFEHEFARQGQVPEAIAVNNGTAALHLALRACGVGPGDEVITVANTFIATAEAITLCGAVPVFADILPGSFLIDPADVERRISPRTRAIVPVHLYGELADMESVCDLAARRGLKVVEDACQAHGASCRGRAAGTFGDAGCLSFYPTKNLGTIGEGGMVLTKDPVIARRVRSLRDHGQQGRHIHIEPGYNYRLPELQAAALRVLLPNLQSWNAARAAAAQRYRSGLAGSAVATPSGGAADESHVYHLFVVRTRHRDALQRFLAQHGIGTAIHYPTPIHLQPAYEAFGSGVGSLPNTERAVSEILSLPMHPSLTPAEVDAVCAALREFGFHTTNPTKPEELAV